MSAVRASSLGSKLQLYDSEALSASLVTSKELERLGLPVLRRSQTLACPFKQEATRTGQATSRGGSITSLGLDATIIARVARVGGSPGPVSPGGSQFGPG